MFSITTIAPLPGQDIQGQTLSTMDVMIPVCKVYNYPIGTIFCSNIEPPVIKTSDGQIQLSKQITPGTFIDSLLPVSEDENFNYITPEDKNEEYLAAYSLFAASPILDDNPKIPYFKRETRPCNEHGIARPIKSIDWKPRSDTQTENEWQAIQEWGSKMACLENIKTSEIKSDYKETIATLHKSGESIRTLMNRRRWEKIVTKDRPEEKTFLNPTKFYISTIYKEHEHSSLSSWDEDMETPTQEELNDLATYILNYNYKIHNGKVHNIPEIDELSKNLASAFRNGFTLDEITDPKLLKKEYLKDIIKEMSMEGANPYNQYPGMTLIEKLMADPKNTCPTDEEGFHIDNRTWKLLIRNLYDTKHTNTLLIGPTGTGKTEIVRKLCEKTGKKLTVIQMGTITDPTEQLVGKIDLKNGETFYDWADFAKAIQEPGVILFDEINRIPDNGDNILFSVLDDTRELSASGAKSDEKRTIKVHPECVFMATANIGDAYTATKQIDEALFNRFLPVELDYLPIVTETKILQNRTGIEYDDAQEICIIAQRTRSLAAIGELSRAISTRETLRCASLIADGFDCLDALETCFLPLYSNDKDQYGSDASERCQVKIIIQQRLNTNSSDTPA